MGYGCVNVVEPPNGLFTRLRNPRPVNDAQVKTLIKSFTVYGLRTSDHDTIMTLVCKRSWLKSGCTIKEIENLSITDIPWVDWTPAGLAAMLRDGDDRPEAPSGLHRRTACQRVSARADEILAKLRPQIDELKAKIEKTKNKAKLEAKLEELMVEMSWQEAFSSLPRRWTFAIYDKGTSRDCYFHWFYIQTLTISSNLATLHSLCRSTRPIT